MIISTEQDTTLQKHVYNSWDALQIAEETKLIWDVDYHVNNLLFSP